ncbi:MAG: response regulator transcription factor [Luteimonas sp.]|nr:response regulator transcription factor [Luteimonas sp.]
MRLLIVEDNRRLLANLFEYLEGRGHVLDAAPDGVIGKRLASTQRYDAIVLDWMLPRLDGYQLLKSLREEERLDVPVLMLTARDELPDKLSGFQAGADDYLTKPFEFPELEARLQAIVARTGRGSRRRVLRVADLEFDLDTQEVTRAGTPLRLFPASRKLLQTLLEASPALVPHSQLEEAVWGDAPPESDRLRSYIHELRRSVDAPFERKLIQTIPRYGYRIDA